MPEKIFINLPVKDLNRSIEFFTRIGFTCNHHFTNEDAACMVISENICVMLLLQPFFKSFTKKEIPDTLISNEVILALSTDSREQVDKFLDRARDAGATTPNEKQDLGFMYSQAFEDPDGHIWEVFYMDPSAAGKG